MHMPKMDVNGYNDPGTAGSQPNVPAQPFAQNLSADRDGRPARPPSFVQSDTNAENGKNNQVRKPLNEAVSSALDAARQQASLPPEVLSQITSQITANVLQQLRANSVSQGSGPSAPPVPMPSLQPQTSASADQNDSSSSFMGSPSVDRASVYTPPSPMRESMSSTLPSPTYSGFTANTRRQMSPSVVRKEVSPRRRISQSDDSDSKDEKRCRPQAARSAMTGGDATILEKCWGKLFVDGQPTERLGQFLRGIAMHIIEDYEPKNSLVITPEKMAQYYEETRLSNELYPWSNVWDDRTSSLSRMFRELEIQHHLIQDRQNLNERPDIPALTPLGFEKWMTLVLMAQPDLEFERLAWTAMHMPINNPDERTERFPKELSRRLLIQQGNKETAQELRRLMNQHCNVKLPSRKPSRTDDAANASQPAGKSKEAEQFGGSSSSSSNNNSNTNNYRPPYVETEVDRSARTRQAPAADRPSLPTIQSDSAVADEPEPMTPAQPIERERRPFVAQPGGGKNYDGFDGPPLAKATTTPAQPPPQPASKSMPPPENKLGRSHSLTGGARASESTARGVPVSVHQQPYAPAAEPRRRRAGSNASREPRSNRNRSPSMTRSREYTRRSDADAKPKPNPYHPNSNAACPPQSRRTDRYDPESQAHRNSFSTDVRDRGREARPRFHSISSGDANRHYRGPDDNSYRTAAAAPPDAYVQHPPNVRKG